ncbi:uncharacterized protein [Rutidosis leptorrhynchoides]|uniref:uncharacterized protein n=1 Tax=Rutidosis leptorrhynchoides TaxID=125765 RepID=UPI003A99A11D
MNREISIEDDDDDNRVGGGVFVSDVSTFIVTDDLCVLPYTPGCCIQLLRDFGVTDAGDIEEITVDLGYQQILDLLRVSFSCNSPLTYVVLNPSRDLFIFQHGTFDLCTSTDETKHEILLQVSTKKSTGKFLFAEAEEDFVDFVSGFLAISLGTVIGKFMKGKSCLVCMDNIYKSISDLSEERYFRSKDVLLYNHVGRYLTRNLMFPLSRNNFPLVEISQTTTPTEQVYRKVYGNLPMIFFRSPALCLNDPRVNGELLKRSGMFMLTDDLVITPSSSISTMNVLNKCNVPLNDIERHKVKIGLKEGIRMVYASMISSSTLSKGLEHQLEILKQST